MNLLRRRRETSSVLLKAGLAAAVIATAMALATGAARADDATWTIVGRQGIMIHVIVPGPQSRDRDAYLAQLPKICGESDTCFVNFYTNSTGATPALPLPDAIAGEPTAVLRRSAKQGVDQLLWSCRLAMPDPGCF